MKEASDTFVLKLIVILLCTTVASFFVYPRLCQPPRSRGNGHHSLDLDSPLSKVHYFLDKVRSQFWMTYLFPSLQREADR